MDIVAPPSAPGPKAEGERRGLVLVHTGHGKGKNKGKSTAAFGLALRAHGRGKAVKIYQSMKLPSARFGEHHVFEQLGVPIEGLGDGFSWKSRDLDHSAQLARDGWARAAATIAAGWASAATQAWLRHSLATLALWRHEMQQALAARGFVLRPSVTPFFVVQPPRTFDAALLRAAGIALRDAISFDLPGGWRISAQPPAAQQALRRALDTMAP